MAAPPELPFDLEEWQDVVHILWNSTDVLCQHLLGNYETAAREQREFPGDRVFTPEVLNRILDVIRRDRGFPIRPAIEGPPPEPEILHDAGAEDQPAQPTFCWKWWKVPVPWTDDAGSRFDSFPLPVAEMSEYRVDGQRYLFSLTALWKLWGEHVGGNPHEYIGEGKTDKWSFYEILGASLHDAIPSNMSKAQLKRSHPDAHLRFGDLQFKQAMVTGRLLIASMAFIIQWRSRAYEFQQLALSFLEHMCALLPDVASFRFNGADIEVRGRAVQGQIFLGILAVADLVPVYEGGGAVSPPRVENPAAMVPLHWLIWCAYRGTSRGGDAPALAKALTTLLAETIETRLGPSLDDELPDCRLTWGVKLAFRGRIEPTPPPPTPALPVELYSRHSPLGVATRAGCLGGCLGWAKGTPGGSIRVALVSPSGPPRGNLAREDAGDFFGLKIG